MQEQVRTLALPLVTFLSATPRPNSENFLEDLRVLESLQSCMADATIDSLVNLSFDCKA